MQSDFPHAEEHIKTLVDDYATKHPNVDPAGRNTILARQLLDPKEAVCQIVTLQTGFDTTKVETPSKVFPSEEPGMWLTIAACSTRSLSRGSVHINSSNPTVHPTIDPAYLTHPLDLDMMARSILHCMTLTSVEPLASCSRRKQDGSIISAESSCKLPTTLDEAKGYVRRNTATEYHPVGTCAMLPREKGGVVDNDLKVYGTSNVRVVDASVFPTHVQGNVVSLVYAIGEKAADIIKTAQKTA
jgi:choline dehydrogenase